MNIMLFSDSHNDFLIEGYLNNSLKIDEYLSYLTNYKIELINFALFTTQTPAFSLELAHQLIEKTKKENKNKIKMLFSIEDLSFLNSKDIDSLIRLFPFCCNLTWNFENQYAGGSYTNLGLTTCGKQLVRKLERNNIFIDTAHLNYKSFNDFIKTTTKPILNTHSGFYFLKNHKRNLTDEQVKLIKDSNGYIGLAFVKDFYDNRYSFNIDFLTTCICKIIDKFGINNIGIGSDFFGTKKVPYNLNDYKDFKNLASSLKAKGLSEKEIQKLMYNNFFDFIKKNEIK